MQSQRSLGVCLRQFSQQFAGTGSKPTMCKNRNLLLFNSTIFQAHPPWLGSNTIMWEHLYYHLCRTTCGGRKWVGTSCLKSQRPSMSQLFQCRRAFRLIKRPIRPLVDSHSFSESYKHILLTSLCRIGLGNIHYWTITILPKRVLHSLQFPSFKLLPQIKFNILVYFNPSRFSIMEFPLFKSVSSFVERSYS